MVLHRLIASFPVKGYPSNEDFRVFFTGLKYRNYFSNFSLEQHFSANRPLLHTLPEPPVMDHEYVEYIPIFEAVEDCLGSEFRMLDLGAGSGRWSFHAACIARTKGVDYTLFMVEAEPKHISFLKLSRDDNEISPDRCVLYEAAVVGDENGQESSEFPLVVCMPDEETLESQPYDFWGQYVERIRDLHKVQELPTSYYGAPLFVMGNNCRFIKVPTITLNRILQTHGKMDLLIMDIQGEEARVIRGAKNMLDQYVGRAGIETHSPEIKADVMSVFEDLGWEKVTDYRTGVAPPGIVFDDYLYYRNPSFRH